MKLDAQAIEFAPGLLAIQESPPAKLPRVVLAAVATLCALMLLWAMVGKLDIVAVAEGKLVPQTYVKIVQPAEAGVISEILVAEGDFVRAGQTLIRLDPTLAKAEGQSLTGELQLKRLTLRRIDAELAGRPMIGQAGDSPALLAQVQQQGAQRAQAYQDALAQEAAQRRRLEQDLKAAQETAEKLRVTLPSYEQAAASHRKLVNEGFLSALAGNEKEREALEKAQDLKSQAAVAEGLVQGIAAQDKKVSALTSNYRSQLQSERTEVVAALARLDQEDRKSAFKQALLELKAPQDGVVKDLATTSRGAVVQPGMVLLTLVPRGETLLAEVQVRNEDIGFVRAGQSVKLKLTAYPFQKYGLLDGTVLTIAADTQGMATARTAQVSDGMLSQPTAAGYKALVKLKTQYLEAQDESGARKFELEAGMQASAEIHQGERTVMEYLLSPVSKTLQEAGRER
ncbi:HlyD family type I secretion periplasmic adaptor subunit [Ramlibacter tataouinensis]|uniref:Membrane fusion protein (MFP) family protein n=1 Tax=Ramlibacter tataouinensis (strain ATCC BAA-407 / DSM 14655 / LMG 21543 / TTB310) TaxID=365046 RepID=F5Y536_RAMTT|nr:HlyD family type I secretion periplasmic adaptor subunit [Ramlibacter tataouinensis]AEG93876.1 CyaD protein-like protein [Ramlibacter tataouinensis TTB310]